MDEPSSQTFSIDQALHGYAGGHRRIRSSLSLSLPAERTLVVLSDLSGGTQVSGFDGYLTGYSVPDTDLYALGRTWYAPEMERPGCVWTHTLLLKHSDLGRLGNLRALLALFKRPKRELLPDDYSQPFVIIDTGADAQPSESPGLARCLARVLYEQPLCAVFVPTEFAAYIEDTFVRVWEQQWPSLRCRFSFCTGALANRELNGRPFDLQAIPERLVREIRREVPSAAVVEPTSSWQVETPMRWLEIIARDLEMPGHTDLRTFLAEYAEAGSGREAMTLLAESFEIVSAIEGTASSFSAALDKVAARYPDPAQGRWIKSLLIGVNRPSQRWLAGLGEASFLRVLATTAAGDAFNPDDIGLRDRAASLWSTNEADAVNLLVTLMQAAPNRLGELLFKSLIDTMRPDSVCSLAQRAPRLLMASVKIRPELATFPSTWLLSRDWQRELVDALCAVQPTPVGKEVVWATLQSNAIAATERLSAQLPILVVPSVLDWLDMHTDLARHAQHRDTWIRLLSASTEAVLQWLAGATSVSPLTVALAVRVLDPQAVAVIHLGAEFWLRLTRPSTVVSSPEMEVGLRAFCFTIAMSNAGSRSDELAAESFEVLHSAAANDRMPYDDWCLFQHALPTLCWWQSWDKCERLRQGVVSAFVRYRWSPATLLRCASDSTTFAQLVSSAVAVHGGVDLVRHLAREVRMGRVAASDSQKAVLLQWA